MNLTFKCKGKHVRFIFNHSMEHTQTSLRNAAINGIDMMVIAWYCAFNNVSCVNLPTHLQPPLFLTREKTHIKPKNVFNK